VLGPPLSAAVTHFFSRERCFSFHLFPLPMLVSTGCALFFSNNFPPPFVQYSKPRPPPLTTLATLFFFSWALRFSVPSQSKNFSFSINTPSQASALLFLFPTFPFKFPIFLSGKTSARPLSRVLQAPTRVPSLLNSSNHFYSEVFFF